MQPERQVIPVGTQQTTRSNVVVMLERSGDANTDSVDDSISGNSTVSSTVSEKTAPISIASTSSSFPWSSNSSNNYEVDGRIYLDGVVSISMHFLDLLRFITCLSLQTHIWNIHNKSHSRDKVQIHGSVQGRWQFTEVNTVVVYEWYTETLNELIFDIAYWS